MRSKKILLAVFFTAATFIGSFQLLHAASPSFESILDPALEIAVLQSEAICDSFTESFSPNADAGCLDMLNQCKASLPTVFKKFLLDGQALCQSQNITPEECFPADTLEITFRKAVRVFEDKLTVLCDAPNLPSQPLPAHPDEPTVAVPVEPAPVAIAPAKQGTADDAELIAAAPASGGCRLAGVTTGGAWLQALWILMPVARLVRKRGR